MRRITIDTYSRGPFWLVPLVFGVLVAALPLLSPGLGVLQTVVSIVLMALLVLGLNVVFGYAGELALGQAAIYCVGAYVGGYFAVKQFDLPLSLVLAMIAAVAVGLLTGIPGLRLGNWSMGMVTFFLVLLIPSLVVLAQGFTGGSAGLTGIPFPTLFGSRLSSTQYYVVVIVVAIIFYTLIRNYVRSQHGAALKIVRESPVLARSLGYSVARLKLTAYIISALPAGAAGCMLAYQNGYIAPSSFTFTLAGAILAASIIGGADSIYGSLLGAAIMTMLPLWFSGFGQFSLIIYGLCLVVGGLYFRGGVAALVRNLVRSRLVSSTPAADVEAILADPGTAPELNGRTLTVTGVHKAFGGNKVLKGVDLIAEKGRVTALIGPNGSGKTTLLNLISGHYSIDAGAITLGDADLVGIGAERAARAGVARTFQTPLVARDMTVAETVASARFVSSRSNALATMLRLPRARRAAKANRSAALGVLSMLGIAHLADRPASELALGTRRILEVARALAADPAVLLLDEPASGLDESEVEMLARVLRQLRDAGGTVVIVEHNFEMVMALADTVNVLHLGDMIASGPPEEVRSDPEVVESYLGKKAREELEREKEVGRA